MNPHDSLRTLDDSISNKGQRVLFCNGSIMMPGFSFSFLGIKDGDHVFVIRPHRRQKQLNETKKEKNKKAMMMNKLKESMKREPLFDIITSDSERNRIFSVLSDPTIIREALRIADVAMTRTEIESTTKFYNLQNITEKAPEPVNSNRGLQHDQEVNMQQPTSPSSEPLPLLGFF